MRDTGQARLPISGREPQQEETPLSKVERYGEIRRLPDKVAQYSVGYDGAE